MREREKRRETRASASRKKVEEKDTETIEKKKSSAFKENNTIMIEKDEQSIVFQRNENESRFFSFWFDRKIRNEEKRRFAALNFLRREIFSFVEMNSKKRKSSRRCFLRIDENREKRKVVVGDEKRNLLIDLSKSRRVCRSSSAIGKRDGIRSTKNNRQLTESFVRSNFEGLSLRPKTKAKQENYLSIWSVVRLERICLATIGQEDSFLVESNDLSKRSLNRNSDDSFFDCWPMIHRPV